MTRPAVIGEQFETILAAARTGAEWAWTRIYDTLAPGVLGYLRARGAPDPEAVCGDVFYQLVRDIGVFEGDEAGFRSWVFVIAHRRLLDDARRRRRRPESPVPAYDLEPDEQAPSAEDVAVQRLRETELRRQLEALTPAQRDVLLLRIFGGLTVEEVARAVGRRPGAVKALQRRGLETLRARLGDRT